MPLEIVFTISWTMGPTKNFLKNIRKPPPWILRLKQILKKNLEYLSDTSIKINPLLEIFCTRKKLLFQATTKPKKGIRAVCQKCLCRKKCRTASKCQRQFADSRFTKKHELTCFRQIAQKTLDVSKRLK